MLVPRDLAGGPNPLHLTPRGTALIHLLGHWARGPAKPGEKGPCAEVLPSLPFPQPCGSRLWRPHFARVLIWLGGREKGSREAAQGSGVFSGGGRVHRGLLFNPS